MARQSDNLLDLFIRIFCSRLLAETRRGLPRTYLQCKDDLAALRGRLDVTRQFSINAVRRDRLACRYDALSSDIPLLQVMKAAVLFLVKFTRWPETRRQLDELRFVFADVSDIAPSALPWSRVMIDRTNRRWEVLVKLAGLFLHREWQATHHDPARDGGITLLFAMNDLFEAYVAALLRRALAGSGIEVLEQGGLLNCLGHWREEEDCHGHVFQTRPDILLRRNGRVLAVIDTKWKRLSADPLDRKKGVGQADVYQMMAYSRLYQCERLMLLYPAAPGSPVKDSHRFGIHGGKEMLAIAQVDVSTDREEVMAALQKLVNGLLMPSSAIA